MALRKKQVPLVTDLRPGAQKQSFKKRTLKYVKKNKMALIALVIVLLVGFLAAGYINARNEVKRLSDPQKATQDQTQDLVSKVGKLIELPSGEAPTIATVKDVNKLKSQEFFARAKDGDKVLIYPKSDRAVIYRPSTDKVIEYSKVNLNSGQ
jgi:uncharacterized protein YneF (UPF0154 family)